MIEHAAGHAQRANGGIGGAQAPIKRDSIAATRSGVANLQRREGSRIVSADRLIGSAVERHLVSVGIERSVVGPVAADGDVGRERERAGDVYLNIVISRVAGEST